MSSFIKIAALFVVSSPLALAGCMAEPEDSDLSADPGMLSQGAKSGIPQGRRAGARGALPRHAEQPAQVRRARDAGADLPGAQLRRADRTKRRFTGLLPTSCPRTRALVRSRATGRRTIWRPTTPGRRSRRRSTKRRIYEAPSFPAPIFERASYGQGVIMPARQLTPCEELQGVSPRQQEQQEEYVEPIGGQGAQELNP